MIVDTSAVLAIAFDEPEKLAFAQSLRLGGTRRMSAGTWLEMFIVVQSRQSPAAIARLERLLSEIDLAVDPVTAEQADVARLAYKRFGRGNHPARLNYGDCFAYALAKVTGETLLFKGDDFSRTDIEPALKP